MQAAKPLLRIATGVVAALLIGACEQPSSAPSVLDKTVPPSTKLADRAGDATGLATIADDTAITAKVKAAMLADAGLKSLNINVETKDAMVTLSGNIDSPDLRERAKQLASSTPGVRSVVDNLTVKTTS
jgi:hyperosmotically inducible periplasmic protein